ncbi:hypothetical protein FLAV_00571 [Flavobacteriales bacterium]|nr:hypothetical protein [Flavobacteriales bacterium]MCL4815459.1 T9SS type A sorting domain-containing protein [Flavobacteriales bacterium]WKZ75078.1 MAG: T9SS type A sorting domain-containing protein [Vicingaceae bacterium]CAG0958544.1 hypothetical protein FLAV_00571 [Flavobacteriales bacterium]
MKKLYTFFASSILILSTVAQTINNAPQVGDSFSGKIHKVAGISEGNTGTSQVWNINVIDSATYTLSYVAPSSTPYSGTFTSSNLASTENNQDYTFYTTSANDMIIDGIGSTATTYQYANTVKFFEYPCSYGTNFIDNFSATYTSGGNTIYRTGTINFSADASGILNTSFGSFGSVLRTKTVQNINDSMNIMGNPVVTNTVSTTYNFMDPAYKHPLFQVIYNVVTVMGNTTTVKMVRTYDPNSNSIIEPTKENLFNVFPNPAKNNITVQCGNSTSAQITVSDITGKVVLLHQTNRNQTNSINISHLNKGMYFISIVNGKETFTKKLMVE